MRITLEAIMAKQKKQDRDQAQKPRNAERAPQEEHESGMEAPASPSQVARKQKKQSFGHN
ncbi:hypothetical protein [Streptomyces sp. JJ36]|uniref:hypothetical protein n=1 Tax=Streptomyces sp. JJ36 TaxID=2736645 RepID=UPI001F36F876|nr:hypothetical protein [Streptomyces sp. JJ36]MCF6526323.1 hypothetical protein [Streptomyces sp. JJ36]